MANTLSAILARISLDNRDFIRGIRETKRAADGLTRIGDSLTKAITLPTAALAAISGKAFAEFDGLSQALKTIEGTSENVTKRLSELSEVAKQPGLSFQEAIKGDVRLRSLGFSAEKSTRIMKEFGNAIALTGGGGAELQRLTVQLSQLAAKGKVLSQDLRPIIETAPVVGKALRDLFGTVDSEEIQNQLNARGLDANNFIDILLDKLSKAPRVTGGFKNSLENLQDSLFRATSSIGKAADEAFDLTGLIERLAGALNSVSDRLAELTPEQKRFAFGFAGIAAAIGPVLSIAGRLIGFFPKLVLNFKTVFSAAGKLTRIAGGLTAAFVGLALVVDNFEPLKQLFVDLIGYFQKAYIENTVFKNSVDGLVGIFGFLGDAITGAFSVLSGFIKLGISQIRALGIVVGALFDRIGGDEDAFDGLGDKLNKELTNGYHAFIRAFDNGSALEIGRTNRGGGLDFNRLSIRQEDEEPPFTPKVEPAITAFDKLDEALNRTIDLLSGGFITATEAAERNLDAIDSAATDLAEGGFKDTRRGIDTLTEGFEFLKLKSQEVTGVIRQTFDRISNLATIQIEPISIDPVSMQDRLEEGIKALNDFAKKERVQIILDIEIPNPIAQLQDTLSSFADVGNQLFSQLQGVFTGFFDSRYASLENYYERERQLILSSGRSEQAKADAIKVLDEQTEKRKRAIQRKEARAAKALALFQIAINTASAIAQALPNIPLAIAVGALGAVQAAIAASTPIPALAQGGVLYGPSLVLAGEYANAKSNPEIIAPLSKLKDLIGDQTGGYGVSVLYGRDILLSSDYSRNVYQRFR